MKVRFKKNNKNAITPTYASPGDACLDLYAASVEIKNNELVIDTGIALEIPDGFVGLVFPRSSISKTSYMLKNSVGVIDSGYRGSVIIKLRSFQEFVLNTYEAGDRVAQIMIIPRPQIELLEVEELSDSVRGEGGFGSTGS